jgi:hypothetical protein
MKYYRHPIIYVTYQDIHNFGSEYQKSHRAHLKHYYKKFHDYIWEDLGQSFWFSTVSLSNNVGLDLIWDLKKLLPCPVTSHRMGQKWSSQFKGHGCDKALSCQGYSIPQGVVTDEHGTMVEWWLAWETWKNSEKTLFQCHFLHHKSHMKSPETEPEAPQ